MREQNKLDWKPKGDVDNFLGLAAPQKNVDDARLINCLTNPRHSNTFRAHMKAVEPRGLGSTELLEPVLAAITAQTVPVTHSSMAVRAITPVFAVFLGNLKMSDAKR